MENRVGLERKPNTRAVYIAALVFTIKELKIKLKTFYSLISEMKQKEVAKEFEKEVEKIKQMESYFIAEEEKERLDKKSEADIIYWNLLSQTKAIYNRFWNKKINVPHVRENLKRVVSVRGVNKLEMAASSYSNIDKRGFFIGENLEDAIFSITGKCTNRHLMIIDAIATEFMLGMENGKYYEYRKILGEYFFEYARQAEVICNHVRQVHHTDELIFVTLKSERIREICNVNIKSKEIEKLIYELAETHINTFFYAFISGDERYFEYKLKNKFKSKLFDCKVLPTIDVRGNTINEYIIYLNTTPFGCFVINNIIGNHFDYVSPMLYKLSGLAQNIFRNIVPDDYCKCQMREERLFSVSRSLDRNNTKKRYRVLSALDELKTSGFIKGYKALEGKRGLVYHINKYPKKRAKNNKGK